MGYTGLGSWGDSDHAFDMTYEVIEGMCDSLNSQLEEKGNEYNTCGAINVALFVESFMLPIKDELEDMEFVQELIINTSGQLKELAKRYEEMDWAEQDNKDMHIDSCNRMLDSLNKVYKTT